MAVPSGDPNITIQVHRSLEPFSHVQQTVRGIFAHHPHEEDFLQEKHAILLSNYDVLKALGPHPLLEWQTNKGKPLGWKNVRFEVPGTHHWIMFIMRGDNLYVRGFANKHNSHEMTEEEIDKSGNAKRARQLPEDYVELEWDVKYGVLFGIFSDDNDDTDQLDAEEAEIRRAEARERLEEEIRRVVGDPNFAVNAVTYLSNYIHVKGSEQEKEAKKMIAGLIFIFCEFLRMNIRLDDPGKLIDKAQHWGDVCLELLKWRDRICSPDLLEQKAKNNDFDKFITRKEYPNPRTAPKKWRKLKEMNINSEVEAMGLTHLMLNRQKDFYDNREKNKKTPQGPGEKGGKGSERGTGSKKSDPGGKDTRSEGSQMGKSFPHGSDKQDGCQGAQMEDEGNSLSWGRRRVQILSIDSNFEIDAINFHDWHRPQGIYRRGLIDETSEDNHNQEEMSPLALVGPRRPIGAYGSIGVEVFPTKSTGGSRKKRKRNRGKNQRVAITESWEVNNYTDDEPSIHHKVIDGPDHQKLRICYMLVPDTLEANLGVKLLLEGGGGGYYVSGKIKAWTEEMEDQSVDIFAHQTVKVPSGQWRKFPLMVSLRK